MALYRCGAPSPDTEPSCLGFRGTSLERAVEEEVLKVLEPGAIEAAVAAGRAATERSDEHRKAVELEVERRATRPSGASASTTPPTPRIGW